MSASIPVLSDLSAEGWHERLVALVRGRSRERVELGRTVDALARRSGHHEMGFSSVGAYVVQRTGLGARFVEQSRALARRLFELPGLPVLAEALGKGEVSWSAAERAARALARRALPKAEVAPERMGEEERAAVAAARSMTVRRLEQWLAELGADGEAAGDDHEPPVTLPEGDDEDRDRYLLERPMDAAERALYEATRQLITFMDGPVSDEQFVEALLAEAHDSMEGSTGLAHALRRETQHRDWADAHSDVLQTLELERCRQEERTAAATEARVEQLRAAREGRRAEAEAQAQVLTVEWASLEGLSIAELDARVRDLAEQIAARDLAMAEAALAVNAARVWRRLGWNSRDQYAREELGMPARSFRALVLRAQRMVELPELQVAVATGELGLEAACAIGRVATLDTVERWIDRASRRTFVHLREEVRAVEMLERNGAPTDLGPPTEAQLEQVRDFERSVASGEWFEALMDSMAPQGEPSRDQDSDRQMCVGPELDPGSLEPDRQMCAGREPEADLDPGRRPVPRRAALVFAGPPGEASERLRLRISDEQAGWWRYLERAYGANERHLRREGAEPMSFVAFACLSVWMTWYPAVKQTGAYDRWTSIYVRDRYQCSSPVCSRRDVTPHHLRFQSHGGGHDDENVAALCSWCHLEGIHGGRIKARPPASAIHWRLGRDGGLEVRGRELRPEV